MSFVKESFIPQSILQILPPQKCKFRGINDSDLKILGEINVSIFIGNATRENLKIFVVPNSTMNPSVILGRETMKRFGKVLTDVNPGNIEEIIPQIFAIDTSETNNSNSFSPQINPHLDCETRLMIEDLFLNAYFCLNVLMCRKLRWNYRYYLLIIDLSILMPGGCRFLKKKNFKKLYTH